MRVKGRVQDAAVALALGVEVGHRPLAPQPHVEAAHAQLGKARHPLHDGKVAEPKIEIACHFHDIPPNKTSSFSSAQALEPGCKRAIATTYDQTRPAQKPEV
jgi:hypothetical protein